MSEVVLSGGEIVTADGLVSGDVRIESGVITEIGTGLDMVWARAISATSRGNAVRSAAQSRNVDRNP